MSPLGHTPLCSKQTTELCVEALDVQDWSSGEHLGLRKSHSLWDVYLDAVWESDSQPQWGGRIRGRLGGLRAIPLQSQSFPSPPAGEAPLLPRRAE